MARDGRSQPPGLGLPCSMGKSDPPVQPMQHSVSSIWTDQLGFGFRVGHPVADKRMERRSERQREREMLVPAASLTGSSRSCIKAVRLLLVSLWLSLLPLLLMLPPPRRPAPSPPLACVSQRLLESWLASWCVSRSLVHRLACSPPGSAFGALFVRHLGMASSFSFPAFRPEVAYPDVRELVPSRLVSVSAVPSSACLRLASSSCVFRHVRSLPSIIFA